MESWPESDIERRLPELSVFGHATHETRGFRGEKPRSRSKGTPRCARSHYHIDSDVAGAHFQGNQDKKIPSKERSDDCHQRERTRRMTDTDAPMTVSDEPRSTEQAPWNELPPSQSEIIGMLSSDVSIKPCSLEMKDTACTKTLELPPVEKKQRLLFKYSVRQ